MSRARRRSRRASAAAPSVQKDAKTAMISSRVAERHSDGSREARSRSAERRAARVPGRGVGREGGDVAEGGVDHPVELVIDLGDVAVFAERAQRAPELVERPRGERPRDHHGVRSLPTAGGLRAELLRGDVGGAGGGARVDHGGLFGGALLPARLAHGVAAETLALGLADGGPAVAGGAGGDLRRTLDLAGATREGRAGRAEERRDQPANGGRRRQRSREDGARGSDRCGRSCGGKARGRTGGGSHGLRIWRNARANAMAPHDPRTAPRARMPRPMPSEARNQRRCVRCGGPAFSATLRAHDSRPRPAHRAAAIRSPARPAAPDRLSAAASASASEGGDASSASGRAASAAARGRAVDRGEGQHSHRARAGGGHARAARRAPRPRGERRHGEGRDGALARGPRRLHGGDDHERHAEGDRVLGARRVPARRSARRAEDARAHGRRGVEDQRRPRGRRGVGLRLRRGALHRRGDGAAPADREHARRARERDGLPERQGGSRRVRGRRARDHDGRRRDVEARRRDGEG